MRRTILRTLVCIAVLSFLGACGKKQEESKQEAEPKDPTYAQNLLGGLDRSTVEKTRMNMKAIHSALQAYTFDHGGYPTVDTIDALSSALSPTYIRSFPGRDAWGLSYVYQCTNDASYTLTSLGIDGTKGTKDDIEICDGAFTKLPDGYQDLLR